MSEMESEQIDSRNGSVQEQRNDMPPPYPGKSEKHGSKTDGNASFLRAARAGNLDKVLEYLKGSTDINTSNANGLNALHLASKEGHVNIVTELLRRGANVDAATKKGNTALHIASLAGQEEIVQILVQNGGKVNVQSQNGFTPLYMASQENHADVVKYLLANGASQGLATEDGFTPLAVALQQGHDKVVAVLLENDTRGKVRLPALHIAAKKDDVKAATLLLQNEHNIDGTSKSGGLVNDTTKSGFTPLHIASHYGNMNVGTLLIEKGADVNFKARNSILPLHVASKWGRTNMVTLLLDNGGLIDGKTRDGLCPLHCGARSGHEQVVDLLLERGANVCAKTKNGLSPLHMAAQGDHVDCARLLLYHKAPIDDVTVDYLTPLHVAAHCGNVRTAKLLLDRKCEVNARALNGFTPLHIACKKNRIKVVELLLKYGASIEATTESGLTPLHVASFMGHMNIVVYLLQHGANPDTPTVRGETALHLAARANQTDIIRILLRNSATVDAKAREQQTPLHIASRLGNENNVVLLLQHGASPDATTKDLYTPLHIAAKEGHEEVAAALLDHGASQNLTTKKGFTPLHIAAKYGNIKVVKLLLQKEADPNVQGKNGLTPLHVATHYNHVNVAMLLLENGASPHCTAKNGYTPLHIAAKKNQMDIASTLLEYGAKPNAESKNGFTPLHLASQEGHVDMVSLLLEHDADVNSCAKNGLTPMHLAAQEDKVPVAEVLVKYNAEIDPQTKAGYTPLHTACHFGQINMIRFLLEQGASVNATTKLGYTPLHQAAQQGHVLVINLLLKYKASPNAVTNTGQTPLSIANRLGYISVVEILKHITEVEAAQPSAQDEKYKVVSPETMQETLMTDSEDEGGEDTILGDQSMSIDDMKFLGDDSITPIRSQDEYYLAERYSTTTASTLGQDDFRSHFLDDSDMGPVFEDQEEKLQQSIAPAPPMAMLAKPSGSLEESRAMYGSYSGASFASSFDPDNVALDRHPIYSGFLVSFMVDARGGAMRGCRHSGVRIIVPPGKACMPTRVTCKLVKKEKLSHPPPMMEGEALASRILEMGPVGAKFQGPVIIEVPHFASLRGKEREIVILRSDNGETWREHNMEATEEAIQEALNGSFEDLESAEELYNKRITRILTSDFPNYFAVVTRIRQETKSIGPESGMLSSTVVPQVQAVFPEGSLTKKIKVGLQAQPIPPEAVSKMLGNRVAVSPIVTVEPRRRKFHKPITLTIPLPKASQKGMTNPYSSETPTLRLLCSITGKRGTSPAQWEDITGTTPLTFVNDCVSFTTTVSARFWLMDCQNINEAAKMATELYRDSIAVPFMAKFVVFAKSHENQESRLRVFCMTDDKMDKTLESQEQFNEIARSKDVEVLEGKPQYLEMAGNLVPVTKSGDQLFINFHGFRENRLPFTVRIRDSNQEPVGRLAFMKEPKVGRGEAPQTPICNLNIRLPDSSERGEGPADIKPSLTEELQRKYDLARGIGGESQEWYCYLTEDDQISKAELRLTDIADALQGDWVVLGRQLDVTDDEIAKIQSEYNYVGEQSLVMLHLWVQKNGENATGNSLERALRKIGREDVIRKCMYNIEEVTDEVERAVAKVHIDQPGFDALKEDLGPSRDSSMHRGMSLDVSYDEQDIMKESESVEGSETGSLKEQRPDHVLEQAIREERKRPEHISPPIGDLIQRVEADQVHGMDDRRASLSSEEDFKGGEFGIQAKAKTKTPPSSPTSGDKGPEQDVGENLLPGRTADAQTLGESLRPGQARLDSQEKRSPAQLVAKEDVIQKSAVTKTQAEFAEPTFEDWVQQRDIQAPAPLRSQDIDDKELYAGPAAGETLPPDGTTFEDWVASKDLKPSEAVSIEPAGAFEEKLQSTQQEVTESAPVVDIPESQAHIEEKVRRYAAEEEARQETDTGMHVSITSSDDDTARFHEPVVTVDSEIEQPILSVASQQQELEPQDYDNLGGLGPPEITFHAASPLVQSPAGSDEFIQPEYTHDEGKKQDDADSLDDQMPEVMNIPEPPSLAEAEQEMLEEEALRLHKQVVASVAQETQKTSQLIKEFELPEETQKEEEYQEQPRPLSPTEYILETEEEEPEGRITADTSQQIFIEQTIEKSRETPQEERPPSPSDFDLVVERDDMTRSMEQRYFGGPSKEFDQQFGTVEESLHDSAHEEDLLLGKPSEEEAVRAFQQEVEVSVDTKPSQEIDTEPKPRIPEAEVEDYPTRDDDSDAKADDQEDDSKFGHTILAATAVSAVSAATVVAVTSLTEDPKETVTERDDQEQDFFGSKEVYQSQVNFEVEEKPTHIELDEDLETEDLAPVSMSQFEQPEDLVIREAKTISETVETEAVQAEEQFRELQQQVADQEDLMMLEEKLADFMSAEVPQQADFTQAFYQEDIQTHPALSDIAEQSEEKACDLDDEFVKKESQVEDGKMSESIQSDIDAYQQPEQQDLFQLQEDRMSESMHSDLAEKPVADEEDLVSVEDKMIESTPKVDEFQQPCQQESFEREVDSMKESVHSDLAGEQELFDRDVDNILGSSSQVHDYQQPTEQDFVEQEVDRMKESIDEDPAQEKFFQQEEMLQGEQDKVLESAPRLDEYQETIQQEFLGKEADLMEESGDSDLEEEQFVLDDYQRPAQQEFVEQEVDRIKESDSDLAEEAELIQTEEDKVLESAPQADEYQKPTEQDFIETEQEVDRMKDSVEEDLAQEKFLVEEELLQIQEDKVLQSDPHLDEPQEPTHQEFLEKEADRMEESADSDLAEEQFVLQQELLLSQERKIFDSAPQQQEFVEQEVDIMKESDSDLADEAELLQGEQDKVLESAPQVDEYEEPTQLGFVEQEVDRMQKSDSDLADEVELLQREEESAPQDEYQKPTEQDFIESEQEVDRMKDSVDEDLAQEKFLQQEELLQIQEDKVLESAPQLDEYKEPAHEELLVREADRMEESVDSDLAEEQFVLQQELLLSQERKIFESAPQVDESQQQEFVEQEVDKIKESDSDEYELVEREEDNVLESAPQEDEYKGPSQQELQPEDRDDEKVSLTDLDDYRQQSQPGDVESEDERMKDSIHSDDAEAQFTPKEDLLQSSAAQVMEFAPSQLAGLEDDVKKQLMSSDLAEEQDAQKELFLSEADRLQESMHSDAEESQYPSKPDLVQLEDEEIKETIALEDSALAKEEETQMEDDRKQQEELDEEQMKESIQSDTSDVQEQLDQQKDQFPYEDDKLKESLYSDTSDQQEQPHQDYDEPQVLSEEPAVQESTEKEELVVLEESAMRESVLSESSEPFEELQAEQEEDLVHLDDKQDEFVKSSHEQKQDVVSEDEPDEQEKPRDIEATGYHMEHETESKPEQDQTISELDGQDEAREVDRFPVKDDDVQKASDHSDDEDDDDDKPQEDKMQEFAGFVAPAAMDAGFTAMESSFTEIHHEYSEVTDDVKEAFESVAQRLSPTEQRQIETTELVDDGHPPEIAETLHEEHAETAEQLEAFTNIKEEVEDVADTIGETQDDADQPQYPQVDLSAYSMTDSMIVSSDTIEHEYAPQECAILQEDLEPIHATLDAEMPEDLHRLKSSSYEDIYKETTFETDKDESDILLSHDEVGDKFDTKQTDEKFEDVPGKTSSYENVYEESLKEASCIEEKDVDELEKELIVFAAEVEKPEKDDSGREKTEHDDLEKDEEYDDFDDGIAGRITESRTPDDIEEIQTEELATDEPGAMASPPLRKYPSPIDITYESGLDQVGQDELRTAVTKTAEEALERSHSYDGSPEVETESRPKFRHLSTPDDALGSAQVPFQTTLDKGPQEPGEEDQISTSSSEMARVEDVKKEEKDRSPLAMDEPEELLMAGDEGHLEEATGGDIQETRVVMRKQVHKKTVIRDGKEETIVTEDTHVEQDNEGPEELRDNMQTLIDQFMDGSGEIPKDPALTQ